MNLAMTDLFFHICRPFFSNNEHLRSCCLWGSVSICRWIRRNCPSRRFQSPNQRGREKFSLQTLQTWFLIFLLSRPISWRFSMMPSLGLQPKKEKEKRTCQDGSRYASQPVSLEWKDSWIASAIQRRQHDTEWYMDSWIQTLSNETPLHFESLISKKKWQVTE